MKKFGTCMLSILFFAGVAVAGENTTRSEKNVEEKTTYSTTVQENTDQPGEKTHKHKTVEQKERTTTAEDTDESTTTRGKVTVKKKHSQTTTSGIDNGNNPGSTQEYHHSETHQQNTTKEVEKK